MTLAERIDQLVAKHGSLRALARVIHWSWTCAARPRRADKYERPA